MRRQLSLENSNLAERFINNPPLTLKIRLRGKQTMTDYRHLAYAAMVVGVVGFLVYKDINKNNRNTEVELAKAKQPYELFVQDVNGNGIPETFIEVNGNRFFLAVDGKNLEDTLRR